MTDQSDVLAIERALTIIRDRIKDVRVRVFEPRGEPVDSADVVAAAIVELFHTAHFEYAPNANGVPNGSDAAHPAPASNFAARWA